ncbi:hypothetical protein HYY75_00055 [bacterium]|nr:hypothetical protein [bacterium]
MTSKIPEIDTESLKQEIKQELLKREILLGLDSSEDIDFVEIAKIPLKRWKFIVVFSMVCVIWSLYYAINAANFYKARVSIFFHGKVGNPLTNLIGGNLPFGLSLGGGGGSDYLIAFLKSETIANELIQKFNLSSNPLIVGKANPAGLKHDDILNILKGLVDFSRTKEGLTEISVETISATLSADIAEGYIGILRKFAKGPEKSKRMFIESQLEKFRQELSEAEQKLKIFQEKNKIFSIDRQTEAIVQNLARLESDKIDSSISLQIQQSVLKSSGNVPELVRFREKELSELAKQHGIESALASEEKKLNEYPALILENAHLLRERIVKEKVFSLLNEQLETAKIAEAEEGSQFEVIDHARPPDYRSRPKRSKMVILFSSVGFIFSIFLAFILEYWEKKKNS